MKVWRRIAESRAGGKRTGTGGKRLGSHHLKVPTKSHKWGYISEPVTWCSLFGELFRGLPFFFVSFFFPPPTPNLTRSVFPSWLWIEYCSQHSTAQHSTAQHGVRCSVPQHALFSHEARTSHVAYQWPYSSYQQAQARHHPGSSEFRRLTSYNVCCPAAAQRRARGFRVAPIRTCVNGISRNLGGILERSNGRSRRC